jgi:hypothetical protein
MWLNMRTEAWGSKETQEYYSVMFQTTDISRKNAKNLLDNNPDIVDNIDMRRLGSIRKQISQELGE